MQSFRERFNSDDYYQVLWPLLFISLGLLLVGIGFRSPWPADEPRFVEVAREMVAANQWLFPMRGGEYYPDKPPVFMWAIAACYKLIGDLKLAFLIPNALCGLLTVFLVYDLGARLWNVRIARNAALLLLLVPQFLIQAKAAQIDAMVMCWITLGCYGLVRHFMLGDGWRWYFLGWAFMGLGVITKGVGFLPLLMMIPIIIYGLKDKQLFAGRLTWRCLLGPVAMLSVIACWLIPMVLTVQSLNTPELVAYQNNILFKQTGERYVNSWHHIKPWYFFMVSVIPWLWFPIPFLLITYWRTVVNKVKADPIIAILLIWVALVILFFSLSPGKRNVYILPALPMLALACSAMLTGQTINRWFERLVSALLWLLAMILLVVGIFAFIHHPKILKKLADYTNDLTHFSYLILTLSTLWIVGLIALRKQVALIRIAFVSALSWSLISTWGYSLLEDIRTPKSLMHDVAAHIGEDAELGLIKFKEQFILFSPMSVTHFSYLAPVEEQERNAYPWLQEGTNRYLLVPSSTELSCFDLSGGKNMGTAHREDWILLSVANELHTCQTPKRQYRYFTEHPGYWMHE
ncbi:glycosyltransferase family 39 protein [Pseudoalteromonas tunicata]|uniref:ArnT family glycosyltransferase n=1 Tax=Pseudoalteromonas tunicata TaxID=314281 RepID=UPI00273D6519|nr:glycosyltransferase family 39 protein [Pseudoalteromonas tunicata]MDP5213637.1 glycosyltransferase family 39 protein [Pseudoalteromonas tunicata]